jgi:hypothetical protein
MTQTDNDTGIPTDEYTNREREDAELICLVLADNRDGFPHDDADAAIEAAVELGASADAIALALAASRAMPSADNITNQPLSAADIWGEAAAQISELWSPGDSIGAEQNDVEPPAAAVSEHPIGFDGDAPEVEAEPEHEPDVDTSEDETVTGDETLDERTAALEDALDPDQRDVADHDHDHHRWLDDGGRC